ncbi:MAG: hypothetical protein KAS30_05910 [Candidatus Diapherotrites archaeon]|nr:hypothetical protein [Candidatus Diapherotrites archaeon]
MKRGQTAIEALLALSIVLVLATASFSGLNEETQLNNSAILTRECTLRAINDTLYNSEEINTNDVMRITGINPANATSGTTFSENTAEIIIQGEYTSSVLNDNIQKYCNSDPLDDPKTLISDFLTNIEVSLQP